MVAGTVRFWHAELGWGVLDSPETSGGCWAHFSQLVVPGYGALTAGDAVAFTYEAADQDAYAFRALEVRPQWVRRRTSTEATAGEDEAVEDPPPLRLAPIDQRNWRAAAAVQISPDQVRLVAGYQPVALVILAKAYVRSGDLDWEPLALTAAASVAGVAALAHAHEHTELLHLAIDVSKQGRGLGSAAVDLLVAHVVDTRPSSQEIRLTVHPENARAQRLYRSRGFLPTGQVRDGEPMWTLDLNRA